MSTMTFLELSNLLNKRSVIKKPVANSIKRSGYKKRRVQNKKKD